MLADRFAGLLFYVAAGAALVTFVVVVARSATSNRAVESTVTVLVIACPHTLGLAIPLVIALSTAIAARNGILSRIGSRSNGCEPSMRCSSTRPERSTRGEHGVTGVVAMDGDEARVLQVAAAVEQESEHPLARAIVSHARAVSDATQRVASGGLSFVDRSGRRSVGRPPAHGRWWPRAPAGAPCSRYRSRSRR